MQRVRNSQRFRDADTACPICGGKSSDPQGKGIRCYGFLSDNGEYAFCTRETSSHQKDGSYVHRMHGSCDCGKVHGQPTMTPKQQKPTKYYKSPDEYREENHGKTTATYPYRNADGQLVVKVYRCERGDKKSYPQSQWKNNRWVSGLDTDARLLYRLPELLADQDSVVFITEGEKCADAAVSIGLVATTSIGGACNWNSTPTAARQEPLRNRSVIILPDNDEPGRKHALQVANDLLGIAASIKIVPLPGLDIKGDIADWLLAGHTSEELVELVDRAPYFTEEVRAEEVGVSTDGEELSDDAREDAQTGIADEEDDDGFCTPHDLRGMPYPEFLIDGVLVERGTSVVLGEPKSGKTFLVLDWLACIATGTPWNSRKLQQGTIAYICGEGKMGIMKRIAGWEIAHKCELGDTFRIYGRPMSLMDPISVNTLIKKMERFPDPPKIVVFDTLHRCMAGGDENSAKDMGIVIAALDRIRDRFGCHVMVVHHKNKQGGLRGSTAIQGAVDTEIDVVSDGKIMTVKCELQKDVERFEPFNLQMRTVMLDEHGEHTSCVLVPTTANATAKLTANDATALRILQEFGATGAFSTQWKNATSLAERSFYDSLDRVKENGMVSALVVNGREKYVLSPVGKEALKTTAEPQSAVRPQYMQNGVVIGTPLGGPITPLHRSAAVVEKTGPVPTGLVIVPPLQKNGRCTFGHRSWSTFTDRHNKEQAVCLDCVPPSTWHRWQKEENA